MFIFNKKFLVCSIFILYTSLTTTEARATGSGMVPRDYADDEDNEIFDEEIDKDKEGVAKKLDDSDYYAFEEEEDKKIEDEEKKLEDEEVKKVEEVEEKIEEEEEKNIEEDEDVKKMEEEEDEEVKKIEDDEEEKKIEEEKIVFKDEDGINGDEKSIIKDIMDEKLGKEEEKRPGIRGYLANFYDKIKGFFKKRFY